MSPKEGILEWSLMIKNVYVFQMHSNMHIIAELKAYGFFFFFFFFFFLKGRIRKLSIKAIVNDGLVKEIKFSL